MFKIMLKGNEFEAKLNKEKKLVLHYNNFSYVLNVAQMQLQQKLTNGKLLVIKLTEDDVNALKSVRMQIINRIKDSLGKMESKNETVVFLKVNDLHIALPKTVYENMHISEKFVEGFLFVLNKELNEEFSYDEIQRLVNQTCIIEKAKFVEDGVVQVYELPYSQFLEKLKEEVA